MTLPIFDPEKLVDFIRELHLHGFVVSTQQYAAAQDLLITLVEQGRVPADPQNLSTWLAPILCTSPEEQRVFHEAFRQWMERQPRREPETREPERQARDDRQAEVKGPSRFWPIAVASGLAVAAAIGAIIYFSVVYFKAPRNLVGYVIDDASNPVSGASVTLGEQTTASNEAGQFSLTYRLKDLPFTVAVSHPEYEQANYKFDNSNTPLTVAAPFTIALKKPLASGPPQIPLVKPPPPVTVSQNDTGNDEAATLQRRFRSWAEIYRDAFKLTLVGIALLPALFFGAWWLRRVYNLRRLRLMKQASGEEYSLNSIMVKGAADQLFRGRSFRRIAQELRRHRQFGSNEIDAPPTVNATIREGGWFTPIYGLRREQPEYLALIDRASLDDHQAQLESALINRLVNDGVIVERYYFHGSPLICRKEGSKARHIDLQELRAIYPNHFLLLFSDGDGLINTLTAEPQRWLDTLANWSVRALLTPKELANWGYHEWALSEQGFVVIPASKEGIAALIETIHTNKIPSLGSGNRSRPFPEMLYERPGRWLERLEPERAVANQLCFQLRRFLGDEVYYLLGACAVYPMLDWKLTLYLAHKLGGPDDLEDKLRRLVRLPWFRHGSMPDWLRLRLISALPRKYEVLTRQALIKLLESSLEKADGRFFKLRYAKGEDTGGDARGRKGLWHGLIEGARAWSLKKRWQDIIRSEPKQSPLRDYVFLTFMSGRKPQRLSLNVPDALRRVMFPEGQPALGLRSVIGLMFAALYSVVAFLGLSAYIVQVSTPITSRVAIRHPDAVYSVAFSPDGKVLVSSSYDETISLRRDAGTAVGVVWFIGRSEPVYPVAFSPDGKTLARTSDDDTIKLWDGDTTRDVMTLTGHLDTVYSMKFSPDGKTLVSGSWDKTIKLWDVVTGKELATLRGHSAPVYSVTFSPDGENIISRSLDNTERVWDASTGAELGISIRKPAPDYSVAFSPDGETVAAGRGDNIVKIRNAFTGKELSTLTGHSAPVYSVAFSPDGKVLASGSWDKTIKLWDANTSKEVATLGGHSSIITSVAFSPDGEVLASGSLDKEVKLWNVSTREELATLTGHSEIVSSVAFSPDGKLLASASGDNTVRLWEVSTRKLVATLKGHSGPVYSVAFSPDGRALASGGWDKTIKLWDPGTGELLATLKGHSSIVTSVTFSPDAKSLASASQDSTVRVWYAAEILDSLGLDNKRP
jgi:WD40 repeat protein